MSLLGGSGSSNSLLGSGGGGGLSGSGSRAIKNIRTNLIFRANDVELRNNLTLKEGSITINAPEKNEILLKNGDFIRSSITTNNEMNKITYNVPKFKIESEYNRNAISINSKGQSAFNKDVLEDASYQVDISGDVNFDGNLYQNGKNALFDLQSLFTYLTKPAPAFDKNIDVIDPIKEIEAIVLNTFDVTIFWKRGKNYDTSYNFSLEKKQLPYVDLIGVDFIDNSNVLQEWVNVSDNISSFDTSYTFVVNQSFTDSFGNSFNVTKDSSFNLRVYPINYTNTYGEPYNYLIFEDISFLQAGPPTEPRNLTITAVSASPEDSFKLTFNKPEFNDSVIGKFKNIKDDPVITKYKIVYQPIDDDRNNRFPEVYNTDQVEIIRDGDNTTSEYTVKSTNDTKVFPGTVYDISLNTKNELADEFGDVSSQTHLTSNPLNDDFIPINLTNIRFQGWKLLNLYNPVLERNSVNAQYFNINEDYNQIQTNNTENNVFVNYTKLGKLSDYRNREVEELASVKLFHIDDYDKQNEIIDSSLSFFGYTKTPDNDNEIDGSFSFTNSSDLSFVDIENIDARRNSLLEYSGFGLQGRYKINLSPKLIGIDNKFKPRSKPYTLGYKISGNNIDKAGTNDKKYKEEFVVDDLNGSPTISDYNFEFTGSAVLYNHGIPSIKQLDISFSWQTGNNGEYFLPTHGLISNFAFNTGNIGSDNEKSRNYKTTEIRESYNHGTEEEIYFIETIFNEKRSNIFKIQSFNCLRSVSVDKDLIAPIGVFPTKFYCDYNSFSKSSNQINDILSFGSDVYIYNPGDKYNLTDYKQSSLVENNQLIFFDGKFVNPEYKKNELSPYADIFIYDKNGTINIDYSSKKDTGDELDGKNVKWVVKKFSNIPVGADSQKKKLIITDQTGTHSNYSKYKDRLFVLQFTNKKNGNDGERQTGWFDLNKTFDSTDDDFKKDRGAQVSGATDQFYLYAENGITFNVYVRIGIFNNDTSNRFIEDLNLEDA